MLTSREFLTDEIWKAWKTDFDQLMAFRKTIKSKPDEYERVKLALNDEWIKFYRTVLFHVSGSSCDCRRCEENKHK